MRKKRFLRINYTKDVNMNVQWRVDMPLKSINQWGKNVKYILNSYIFWYYRVISSELTQILKNTFLERFYFFGRHFVKRICGQA